MLIEISVLCLLFLLTLILTVYNQRQAAALRGIERLVQDFVAMQMRDRRARAGRELQLDPLAWLSALANAGLEQPLTASESLRIVQEVQAVELRTTDGRRLVVSPRPKSDLLRCDRRLRMQGGQSAAARVGAFAWRPLLNRSRWGLGVQVIECSMSACGEFFDLEAAEVAKRFGLDWGLPTRLWCYVV